MLYFIIVYYMMYALIVCYKMLCYGLLCYMNYVCIVRYIILYYVISFCYVALMSRFPSGARRVPVPSFSPGELRVASRVLGWLAT